MLYPFKKSQPQSNTLEDIARRAFVGQTLVTKNGVLQYAKEDIYLARLAYDAYLEEKSNANLIKLQATVETCLKNERPGFSALSKAILKLLQKDLNAEPSNDQKKVTLK